MTRSPRRLVWLFGAFSAAWGCGAVRSAPLDAGADVASDDGGGVLPACPAPSGDRDGAAPVSDGGYANWTVGADAAAAGGLSIEPVPGEPDSGVEYTSMFPTTQAAAPTVPLRPLSPFYQVSVSAPVDVFVTIPLAPELAGCRGALYAMSLPDTTWRRWGDLATGSVAGALHATMQSFVVAGACSSECNRACVDLANDDANCGQCGNACPSPSFCVRGACGGQVLGDVPGGRVPVPLIALDAANVYFVTPGPSGVTGTNEILSYPKTGGPYTVHVPSTGSPVFELRVVNETGYASAGGGSQWGVGLQPADGGAVFTIGGGTISGFWGPFAVDGTNLYYGVSAAQYQGPGKIERLPVTATTTSGQIVLAQTSAPAASLDTDGKRLVWVESGAPLALDLTASGASPIKLATLSGSAGTWALHMDGDSVFGIATIQGGGQAVVRMPLDGSAAQALARARQLGDLGVVRGVVAWTDEAGVWAELPGASPTLLRRGMAGAVAVDDAAVYIVDTKVWRLPLPR
jgi:hypothetical protein